MYQFSDAARVYLSNSKSTFVRQNDAFKIYSKKNLDASTGLIVEFDANVTEHEIEGFGGAMTDTSAQMLSACRRRPVKCSWRSFLMRRRVSACR